MRRRRAQASFIACLVLVISSISTHVFARRVNGKQRYHREHEKRPAKEPSVGVITVGIARCKSEKIGRCGYLAGSGKNDSLAEDEKRIVPTGSNPLHNK
ncbi:unnamed protein product [Musa acuminata subsp. malaccensis]|uniref:(wild Malaysian banana) hypothetical protein n=1 Tax=Musa acuminata subsp. malaccensis TaxID=214687 RepID=A0A804JY23_MUSAM|nr:unnamed protein product [Musa acuminata subsp. malaccensis]